MSVPTLKKRLGQHHLIDGALARPLVEFLRPAGLATLEVGPGGGALTAELLAAGASAVWAWELDPAWAAALRLLLPSARLRVVVGDALEIPWDRIPVGTLVAGNLPYGIATRLLARLLPCGERIPRAAFLVQKEVAERLLASPSEAAYGSLSVMVAAYSVARLLGRVRRGSFRPPPRVEGAFVGFELKAPPLPPAEMEPFLATVHLAFGRRRKTLRNSLAAGWGREAAAGALARAALPPGVRAETLGLEELLRLHRARLAEVVGAGGGDFRVGDRKC